MTEDERADWIQQLLASADVKDMEVHEVEAEERTKLRRILHPARSEPYALIANKKPLCSSHL